MSAPNTSRVVPIWMLVLCWLVALPMVIDGEFWIEIKLPIFVSFLILTIGLLRHRAPTS
ncbi:MAG: hypothetical protein R3190_02330 [Thermoanaerobaculia bacterium]|nr:hypothetical protein [Thermoanaerobaculia bacterium]